MKTKGYQQPFRQQPSNRRTALKWAIGGSIGLGGIALLGCRQEERPVARPETKEPKRGGVLIHGSRSNYWLHGASGFDPHTGPGVFATVAGLFYQNLLSYDVQVSGVQPEIVQSWEQPSQTDYILKLQPGVRWHRKPPANGRDLTVEDVIYSLERARTPNPRFLARTLLDTIDSIEPVDKATIHITTKRPDAAALSKLAGKPLKILAPEVIERFEGKLSTADTVIGTGPFILTTAEEGVGAEVVRNPDYWKPGLPYLDGIRTPAFADEQSAWAAFLAGRVDVSPVPGSEVKAYLAQQGPGYTPAWNLNESVHAAPHPNTKVKPFDDPRVAKALRLLFDHEEMLRTYHETAFGRGQYGVILPAALDAWDLSHEEYSTYLEWKQPKDEAVREALALLRAAGFTREAPLRFELTGNNQIALLAQLIQAQWKRLSQGVVDITLEMLPAATAVSRRGQRNFGFFIDIQGGVAIDPDIWLTTFVRTNGSQNYTGWNDPTLDAMIEKQAQVFDRSQRKALVREVMIYLIDNSPYSIANKSYTLSGERPHVRGHLPESGVIGGAQYERVWLDT